MLPMEQEAKKEEIISEKDDCLNERSKLELKRARTVHDIAKELEHKKSRIEELERESQEKLSKVEEAKSVGMLALANERTEEVLFFHFVLQRLRIYFIASFLCV